MWADWVAFILLITLYLSFANKRFVNLLRGWARALWGKVSPPALLVIPFALVAFWGMDSAETNPLITDFLSLTLYIAVPIAATLLRPKHAKALHPLDILAILAIWLPIELDWLPELKIRLAEGVNFPLATLIGLNVGFFCFLVLRPLPFGYTFRLKKGDFLAANRGLMGYTLVGIPLGLLTGFLIWSILPFDIFNWVLAWPLGYLFVALPEEMLFRGMIQSQIHKRVSNEWLAIGISAIFFGLAHINNSTAGFPKPNWMFGLVATIAGVAYGWTFRKTGKITASALVHATVNFVWVLFLSG